MSRLLIALGVFLIATGIARADRREAEFLQALRDKELSDVAVGYLSSLEASQQIPRELQITFDLEYARSLISESETTPNVDRAAQNLVLARNRLEKFLKEHGDHPEAAVAWKSVGQIGLARGDRQRLAAERLKDKTRQQAELGVARGEFEQARPAFQKAIDLLASQVSTLQAQAVERAAAAPKRNNRNRTTDQSELADVTEQWLSARFLAAQVDYLIGLTYLDAMDPARAEALKRASKGFDDIFQGHRTTMGGVNSHLWQGRSLEALGDLRTALDIYQEVLRNSPDPGERNAVDRLPFFVDVKRSEIELLGKTGKPDEAFQEAQDWLEHWQSAQRLPGYQAIVIDFAKMLEERAAKLDAKESERLISKASATLTEIAKRPGRYQSEAIRLRRDLAAKMGRTLEVTTFADAVALGEGAAQAGNWADAAANFQKAVELSEDVKPVERIDTARLQLAKSQLFAGNLPAAFETANGLAREQPPRDVGPSAAVIALNAALNLAATAPAADKPAARKQLFEIADFTKATWPKRAEADEAAIAIGRLQLVEGDFQPAIETFEAVNPASERYGQAQLLAAQTRWRILQQDRRAGNVNEAALTEGRTAIIEQIKKSIELQQQQISAADPESPQSLNDARLQLAELYEDAGNVDDALALYGPLVDSVMQQPDAEMSPYVLRVTTGAASAFLAKGNLEQARRIAEFLEARGGDVPVVNTVLTGFAGALRKQAQPGSAEETALIGLVEKLSQRENLSLRERIILGDLASDAGRNDLARSQFELALKSADAGSEISPQAKAALVRVRAQLVGLLRQEKKYEQALTEVDKLLQETPKALEPNMERARILLALAEADPTNAQRYGESVAAWSRLRAAMTRLPKKPPEYYESVLGCAKSLAGQASALTDAAAAKEARKQARQLLVATLALSPSLTGPEMVERYNTLLAELPGQ